MMFKINWKVRFGKDNLLFWIRFLAAVLIPVLAYLQLDWSDFNTWASVWLAIVTIAKNPFLWGLIIINALNLIPDPTTKGISDSEQAMMYEKPKEK